MIFLDTSAVIALANRLDPRHDEAVAAFAHMLGERESLLTHSYVLAETVALLQRRLGLDSALAFARQSREFEVHWVEHRDHEEAVTLLARRDRRGLSLVDCASFVVMRRYGVTQALAFDGDFVSEGFSIYRANRA